MSVFNRLYQGLTDFDFVGRRRRWFVFSASVLAIAVLAIVFRGFNRSVDFEGGVVVETVNTSGAQLSDYRDALAGVGQQGARVQLTGGGDGVRVQTAVLTPQQQTELIGVVADAAGVDLEEVSEEAIGPTFGTQITKSAIRALVVFLIVVVLFISWRFEWKMALAGIAALGHDLLITGGIYALVGFEVTPATVIAVLTILGYSLYDTVVVFDKVTEHVEDMGDRHPISDVVNVSMNQVLMRSLNTSLTSLLPVGSLLFVGSYLLGAATLREFALALFIGITAGTYSSIFVASPLLAVWKEREERWRTVRRRAARRAAVAHKEAETLTVEAVQPAVTGATPRPPKRRRRRR